MNYVGRRVKHEKYGTGTIIYRDIDGYLVEYDNENPVLHDARDYDINNHKRYGEDDNRCWWHLRDTILDMLIEETEYNNIELREGVAYIVEDLESIKDFLKKAENKGYIKHAGCEYYLDRLEEYATNTYNDKLALRVCDEYSEPSVEHCYLKYYINQGYKIVEYTKETEVESPYVKAAEKIMKNMYGESTITLGKTSKLVVSDSNYGCTFTSTVQLDPDKRKLLLEGIWENDELKERGDEINMELVKIYFDKKKEELSENFKTVAKKMEETKNEFEVKFDKLVEEIESYEDKFNELFLSQFTEEEIEEYKKGGSLNTTGKTIKRFSKPEIVMHNLVSDYDYKETDEYKEAKNTYENQVKELNELQNTVQAHVAIAKDKEEIEDILGKYGIIKKGKLNI